MKDLAKGIVFVGIFLILFIPTIVTDSMFFPYITGKNFTFRILVEIVVAGWAILALLDPQYRPRFSWIAVSGLALLVVMFFANLFGEYPLRSFWSNFERMEGYVTLVHFYLYFMVLGSVLRTQKLQSYFIHTSIAVAIYVALYGLGQTAGLIETRSSVRIESTLGNSAYMAVYMLFHVFLVLYLGLKVQSNRALQIFYGILFLLFAYVLLQTGTRGTFIGFVFGGFLTVTYIALFAKRYPQLKKVALGAIALMIVLAGLFVQFRDSSFIQSNGSLARIANISLDDLTTRATIWGMALEGVKERPVLGWGQGNFSYVFNKQYEPSLFQQESWFDRVHNIFFDWLIAGGIVGLIAYLSIFVSALYYLFWRPMFNNDESFTVVERAVLVGILAGYFTHNIVVFDNIVSYLFFALILALIHARVSTPIPSVEAFKIDRRIVSNIIAPIVLVALVGVLYVVNVPNIQAAKDIIEAFREQSVEGRLAQFEEALSRGSFANQEIREQLAQQAMGLANSTEISAEAKERFLARAGEELEKQALEKPRDTRIHVFNSGYYRSINDIENAKRHIDIARELSPNKQQIILQQGILASVTGDMEKMRDYFKVAYELDTSFKDPREFYGIALLYTGDMEEFERVITEEHFESFALNDSAISAANNTQQFELLKDMFEVRIANDPTNGQNYASLSSIYYREGKEGKEETLDVLRRGVEASPEFKAIGECYIENIEADLSPEENCHSGS